MSVDHIKNVLFTLLESDPYAEMSARGQYGRIAQEAVAECTRIMDGDASRDEMLQTLATGILHYTLTKSGTPSRRKAAYDGVELDIVIPGTRELQKNPGSVLVIQVCCDCKEIAGRLHRTGMVQPVPENIWVLTQDCPALHRYTIAGERATMPAMVEKMIRFAKERRYDRLGMMP